MSMKRTARAVVAAAACALGLAAVLAGCGSSESAAPDVSTDFFQKACENLQAASSFRMTGNMVMQLSDPEQSMSINYGYDMWLDVAEDGSPISKMEMTMSSDSLGDMQEISVEIYTTADRMYVKDPASGTWSYQDLSAEGSIASLTQDPTYMNPTRIKELLEAAQTVEAASEDADYVTYSVTLDPEKAFDEEKMSKAFEIYRQQGMDEEQIQAVMDTSRDLISSLVLKVMVEKESSLLARCEFDFGENLMQRMAPLFSDSPAPEGSEMTMTMAFDFSDYGVDFGIELPPEALNATPLQ